MTNPTASSFERHVRILGDRPARQPAEQHAPIPADATIYNARHPLSGTLVNGKALCWQTDAIGAGGKYYAAVLPNAPNAHEMYSSNRALGAFVVEYVSIGQVRAALRTHAASAVSRPSSGSQTMTGGTIVQRLWRRYVGADLDKVAA